jgi:hypothetical protein
MLCVTPFQTVDALKKLGFEPDSSVLSDDGEGLFYDFGNMTLSARSVLNESFIEIISVSGVLATGRSIALVSIQLPPRVTSTEQCAAFIAWGIDKQNGREFVPLIPTDWLDDGRNNFDTLPWVRKQKQYQERPRCIVERDWLKLAFRDLRLLLPELAESDFLSLTFQNEVFSIHSRLKLIVLPAAGNNWTSNFEITAKNFRSFPKRLNHKDIEISIWENYLYLANWRYPIDRIIDAEW